MNRDERLRAVYQAVAAAIVVLDQGTKQWAAARLKFGPDIDVIDGLLRFVYAENPGIAFSLFSSGTQTTRWVLAAFSTAAAFGVIYLSLRTAPALYRFQVTLALLLGGIVGNLIDRALTGRVIDFIDVYVSIYHWPTFNIADSAISVGAVLLAYELFRPEQPAETEAAALTPEEGEG